MPVITQLKVQTRNTSRYNLYLDGVYKFPVSANTVLAAGLHVGQEISEEELATIQQTAEIGNAHDKALSFLDLRRRSEREMRDYLRRKEYSPSVIDAVVERLIKAGLLNDADFARAWLRDRMLLKSRSRRALSAELAAKGINREIAEAALDELDEGSEEQAVREAVAKKLRTSKFADGANEDKLIASLARQGFRYADIRKALDELV